MFGLSGLVAIAAGIVLWSAGTNWFSRRMERRADAVASTHQVETGVYARALEKLYCENQMPAVNATKRMTHPHLYDRLLAAGVTPEYPRPAPPRRLTWIGRLYLMLTIVLGLLAAFVSAD